jgi:hypothetical protein
MFLTFAPNVGGGLPNCNDAIYPCVELGQGNPVDNLIITVTTHKDVYYVEELVRIMVGAKNIGEEEFTLNFRNSQRGDFAIINEEGETVFHWYIHQRFVHETTPVAFSPGETVILAIEEWDQIDDEKMSVPIGTYRIDGWMVEYFWNDDLYHKSDNASKYIVLSDDTTAPEDPERPSGPASVNLGETYTYTTTAVDPDGDKIRYGWDWDGDMTIDEWTEFEETGETIEASHSWSTHGSYTIRVKAMDEHGAESGWSEPLPISMPKSKTNNPLFLNFLENHPHMFPILRHLFGL